MSDVQSSHGNSESVSLYEVIVEHATGVPLSHVYIAADQSGISETTEMWGRRVRKRKWALMLLILCSGKN